MATREGGSEWELIKILSEENSAYVPKSLPNVLHMCCQDHVAITVLLTLGATQRPKHSKQAAKQPTRVHRPVPVKSVTSTGQTGPGPGHPGANRDKPGHPDLNTGSPAQLL